MHNYGIRGNVNILCKSYLSNKQQNGKVNNANSENKPVKCGIPQLLFTIYINNLANSCKDELLIIFAEDTGIFCHSFNLKLLVK